MRHSVPSRFAPFPSDLLSNYLVMSILVITFDNQTV